MKKKSRKEKRLLVSAISGKIIQDYKCSANLASLTSRKLSLLRSQSSLTKKRVEEKLMKTKKDIQKFLEDDARSQISPGIKDTITRQKTKKQKRILTDSMKNLHEVFIKECPEYKLLSYTFFLRFRPFWIVRGDYSKRQTTLCKIHENFSLMIRKLKFLNMISENSSSDLLKSLCCDTMTEECLERTCKKCIKKEIGLNPEIDLDSSTSYDQWVTENVELRIKGNDKISKKTVQKSIRSSKGEVFRVMIKAIPKFMQHTANLRHQHDYVRHAKENLGVNEIFIHMDFSENYVCKYASEIQSAHFGGSKPQVTLHTSVVYYKDETGKIVPKSCATISEINRHDPSAIIAHMKPIVRLAKELVPKLDIVHILSDGPTTQYRNKSMFQLFGSLLSVMFRVHKMHWHYSESGHGKGAPDGVGGYLKRTADSLVGAGTDISNHVILLNKLKENCKNVNLWFINQSSIYEIDQLIPT